METSLDSSNCTFDKIQHVHWTQFHMKPLSYMWHVVFATTGLVVFIAGVIGNVLVLLLFVRFRSLRSFSNLFVLNLTAADFLLCVGNIPMFIIASFYGYWVFDVIGCHLYAFVGSVSSFVSINTLAAIAVDRCLVIVKLLSLHNRKSRKYCYLTIITIWLYSAIWAVMPLFEWGNYILEGTNSSCTFDFLTRSLNNTTFVIGIFTAHFIVPVSVICCSYILIYRAISKHRREFAKATRIHGEEEVPLSVRKHCSGMKIELKTAKVSVIVILVFCISWFPYAIVALIGVFGDISLVTRLSAGIPCLCAKTSTVMNPLIYALLHPKFKVKLLSVCFCGKVDGLEAPSYNGGGNQFRSVRLSESRWWSRYPQRLESNSL